MELFRVNSPTPNPVIDQFFRALDARLADPSLSSAQRAMLKKLRPQFLQAARDDPEYFVRELMEAASGVLKLGKG